LTRFVALHPCTAGSLASRYGGEASDAAQSPLGRFVPLEDAGSGDLAPLLSSRYLAIAGAAVARGATLLVAGDLRARVRESNVGGAASLWFHDHATWAMARVLEDLADVAHDEPRLGVEVVLGAHVSLGPRVVVGDRVTIGPSSVIGSPGFGWAVGPGGERVRVPQLGGVVIEDDVWIGPLVTIDAGTLGPTVVRRGVKLDAHVHVGHNCEVGEGTIVAAQSGFAGSVRIGRRVMVGGQVGVADHVRVGDDARIAAKSGVIGDVRAGAVVAGYPAVARGRWLRGLAALYRGLNESAE